MFLRILASLGDELALTAVVREFKKQYPHEVIHVENRFTEIFDNNPYVNVGEFDTPYEAKLPAYNPREFLFGNYAYVYGSIIGIKVYDPTPEIFLSEAEKNMFKDLEPTIAIDTWAGWPSRRWKFENWIKTVDLIRTAFPNVKIIEVGKSIPDCNKNIRTQFLPNIDESYVDKTKFREIAALLYRCKLFVGCDSGLMHVSAAVGTKQVCLFTMPPFIRGVNTTYPVVNLRNFCFRCHQTICNKEKHCLDGITPQDVLEVIKVSKAV